MGKRTLEDILASVAAATVLVGNPERQGQGVLVEGGFIMTAAHCLEYDTDTGMRITLQDHIHYEIQTATGEKMQVAPLVIESCSDIAVLGVLDAQTYPPEMVEPFEDFCERTKPVPLCRKRFPNPRAIRFNSADRKEVERFITKFKPTKFRVHIRTHEKTWITGEATIFQYGQPWIVLNAEENIEGGTSGGPIINDAGGTCGRSINRWWQ